MQSLKTRLRPWVCSGLSGATIRILLLGFATGFQWDDQCTSDNWRDFGLLATVLVLPCVANSLPGVCVERKLARREMLLLLASFWLIPSLLCSVLRESRFVLTASDGGLDQRT